MPRIPGDLARGNRTIFLGDSITLGGGTVTATNVQLGREAWSTHACLLSKNRMRFLRNAGVGSETTAQMLARIAPDVIAHAPDKCVVMGGTNDIGTSVPLATIQANIIAIVAALRIAGIVPILCTIPPRSTKIPETAALNRWLLWYADQMGLQLLDFHAVLIDPATGGYKNGSAWSGDGVHPNGTSPTFPAVQAMAEYAVAQIATWGDLFADSEPWLTRDSTAGTGNLLLNGCFIGDSNLDGVANSWAMTGAGGTVTPSLEAGAGEVLGNWQVITATVAGQRTITQSVASGWAVGDRLALAGRFFASGVEASGMTTAVRLRFSGGNFLQPIGSLVYDITDGLFAIEGPVPAGTTTVDVDVFNGGSGTGVLKVAQLTLLNLTALGLV